MTSTEPKIIKYQLMVVELYDVVARRDPKKPNLFVAKTISTPEARFMAIKNSKKPSWYTKDIKQLRPDLAPPTIFHSKKRADTAYKKLVKELGKQRFTVNKDTRVWSVYVIEINTAAIPNPGKGVLYVGETSKTPEERCKIHNDGVKNKRGPLYSKFVFKHKGKLRPDLAPKLKYFSQKCSKKAEKEHFNLLKAKGYIVEGGR
jgi:hypothetical protein